MATRHVNRLSLAPQLRDHLIAHNLTTARDVLLLGPLDLMELLGLTWSQAAQLLADVSAQITPPYTTAWEALAQLTAAEGPPPLRTGLPTLDGALRLGLPAGSITELVGPGGVGKSQMCHMMALAAALPAEQGGLAAGVVYIDTERKFSAARLAEMVRARAAAAAAAGNRAGGAAPHGGNGDAGGGGGGGGALVSEVLQRVVVMTPGRTEELVGALESLQTIVLRHKARLVVIDSIAALARTEYGNVPGGGGDGSGAGGGLGGGGGGGLVGSILERQQVLGRIASQLKALAESLRVPVLVTNQVTTRITPAAGGQQPPGGGGGGGGGGTLTAALGTKWAHCVNLRLVLERLHERRFLKVAKSPSCANVVLEYVIGPTGLQQVEQRGAPPPALRGNVMDLAILNEVEYGAEYG